MPLVSNKMLLLPAKCSIRELQKVCSRNPKVPTVRIIRTLTGRGLKDGVHWTNQAVMELEDEVCKLSSRGGWKSDHQYGVAWCADTEYGALVTTSFHFVCSRCNAKYSAPREKWKCPRCGRQSTSTEQLKPPWRNAMHGDFYDDPFLKGNENERVRRDAAEAGDLRLLQQPGGGCDPDEERKVGTTGARSIFGKLLRTDRRRRNPRMLKASSERARARRPFFLRCSHARDSRQTTNALKQNYPS